jgi:hypothetical protein
MSYNLILRWAREARRRLPRKKTASLSAVRNNLDWIVSQAKEETMTRCGTEYPVESKPLWPRAAKFALYWWDKVVFASTMQAAEVHFGKLNQYQKEDARIESKKGTVVYPQ